MNVRVNLTHTWNSDIDMSLRAPNGTLVLLSSDNGADGDNYTNTLFDDEALVSVVNGASPFNGTYRPEGLLSTFDGMPVDGSWRLEIFDDATQDTGTLLGAMMQNPWSQEMAWSFVQTNWQRIVTTLGEFQGIPSIIESLRGFCSAARAQEVRAFFSKNPVPSSQRGIQQAIERIENCVAVKERQAKPFASWIAQVARK